MSREFKILKKDVLVETDHFSFLTMVVESDGAEKLFPQLNRIPAALIVPITPTRRTAILRQFRFSLERDVWEFCAGGIDPGETADVCAIRELHEEMGLRADKVIFLGECEIAPNTGHNHISIFCAEISDAELDRLICPEAEDEIIETRIVTLAEIEDMIDRGEFNSGIMLAAYGLLRRYLDLQK